MTQGRSGGGKMSDTTTSRGMLTFSPSIFTTIRSAAGWRRAEDWPWSSAADWAGKADVIIKVDRTVPLVWP